MRIAITGAAGWIGRSVASRLGGSHNLLLLDSVDPSQATVFDPDSVTGRRLEPLTTQWPYRRIDILDTAALQEALSDAEVVIHLAARPTGDWENGSETMRINVLGTYNVFEAAQRAGVRRVVSASSINAFGTFAWRVSGHDPVWTKLPLTEEAERLPEDPYSLSKGITEDIAGTFQRAFGLESVSLRFAAVWPEERYNRTRQDGLAPTTQWAPDLYEWVHLLDVTEGIALAATAPSTIAAPIVLGAGDTYAPEPSLDLIRRFRPELEALLVEPLPGRSALLSISRARSFLGYSPKFSLAD